MPELNKPKRYVVVSTPEGQIHEHRLIAERALGRKLSRRNHVHHVNGDPRDNRPGNLVICQDAKYHRLLHIRADALRMCGHVHWRQCCFCGKWEDPDLLVVRKCNGGRLQHPRCYSAWKKQWWLKVKAEKSVLRRIAYRLKNAKDAT